jgi:hypothetical protein
LCVYIAGHSPSNRLVLWGYGFSMEFRSLRITGNQYGLNLFALFDVF